MKKKRNWKWKNPYIALERRTLCFSSYKNYKLKVKLWWVGASKRKKRVFFVWFILSEGIFFNICVLSQCIVYWIRFQNIHTFTYQKILLHTLFCLFLKSSKAFSLSLILGRNYYLELLTVFKAVRRFDWLGEESEEIAKKKKKEQLKWNVLRDNL